ncbi:MAG: NAD-dependent epimerase/dehydratase family protein [Acidimicrobiia bacterium]
MRYTLTGATGFLGGELVRLLRRADHEVTAVVRDPVRAHRLEEAGVRLVRGDVADRGSLRPALEGAEGVFHLAAWYQVGRRNPRAEEVNLEGTRNVLELVGELGVGKAVYTSTLAVFSDTGGRVVDESHRHEGPHLSQYDRTKWLAHYRVAEPLAQEGVPIVIVQPGVTYGPGDTGPTGRLLRSYLRGRLRVIPRGTAYCWGHVEDTARAHLQAMERGRPGETYIVAGPPHTLVEAFEIAERLTAIPAPPVRLRPGVLRGAARLLTAVERAIPPLAGPAELLRVGAGVTYLGDSSKAEAKLGFEARSLEDGFETVLPELLRELQSPPPRRTG